ncbi:uncharacterized protein K460DRAFT_367277 [Cucurbitaria berberidis CBS 394.84]|uniref:BTB domain-containing protein n=1 Tax=Cucurbitaria berberidis CBS 394.84 TaxID=1168544 RepID=A0A9P4GJT8_9PLEO|nr:uncharacterized protein K460DRAFT_367277 [Cucurbitaria berberidis CBS 394.84]KAF1846519.1 hypothetical protein K460DRAFT_367277 [Cucurbitaria berberidis CBS 394.84]
MANTFNAMEIDPSHAAHASSAPSQHTLDIPRPTELPPGDLITLDVDGRKFRTRKSTLQNCGYFSGILSGRFAIELLPDGSLPVDADPDVFPTLLNYLRTPSTYPLLWTQEKGFDYVGYNKLLAVADFFGLEDLKQWIQKKTYLKAITTYHRVHVGPAYTGNWFDTVPFQIESWPSKDPRNLSNIEILQSFVVGVPSQGRFLCNSRNPDHFTAEDCLDEGQECIPDADNLTYYNFEKLEKSIANVVRCVVYNGEVCLRGYTEEVKHTSEHGISSP